MEGSYKCGENTISVDTGVLKIEQSSVCRKHQMIIRYHFRAAYLWLGSLWQLNKDYRLYQGDSSEESFGKPSECASHPS